MSPQSNAAASSLTKALILSSDAPILLLDDQLTVLAASSSFCAAFQLDPVAVVGSALFELGAGEWNVPQLRSLLKQTLSGALDIESYEMDLMRAGRPARRLVLRAHTLDYGDPANVRLVLAVSDVTDARLAERLKDNLVQEKSVLLQELQHRVANSLQIIASVLLQSARKVASDESQGFLFDAYNRVMSIASLQRHLATSAVGEVVLREYFTQLCESIGASVIVEPDRLRLTVTSDDSVATANVSVSLGLIVTELVINALKHAFPDGRKGRIAVDFLSHGPSWALTVRDDGIGMPSGELRSQAGLGSSVVAALAQQLHAVVSIVGADPGTTVSITHDSSSPEPAPELAV